ncbi:MAG: hypothetical protein ACKPJD_08465, partial [Planctomycetaceae bacterium]
MTPSPSRTMSTNYPADEIEGLLERHGQAIRNQQPLRIEDLLPEIQPEWRAALLTDLLLQELELRQPQLTLAAAREEFKARFPEEREAVSEV